MAKRLSNKADLVNGQVPLAQLPYKAGNNVTIAQDGTIATTESSASARAADVVKTDRTRTYYDTAADALGAAASTDTVNLYSPVPASPQFRDALLDLSIGVSVNTHGNRIASSNQNNDVVTFRGGPQVFNGNNTVLTQLAEAGSGAWILGAYPTELDVYIYDTHLDLPYVQSTGFGFFATGYIYYRGNIKSDGQYVGQFVGTNDGKLHFQGEGRIEQSAGLILWVRSSQALVEWRGDTVATTASRYQVDSGTLVLREGTLYGDKDRTAGSELLVGSDMLVSNTLILDNYTVLGTPGTTAIKADKVVLRGSTVVVGNIVCNTLDDQRPKASSGSGSANYVDLTSAQQIGGQKTFKATQTIATTTGTTANTGGASYHLSPSNTVQGAMSYTGFSFQGPAGSSVFEYNPDQNLVQLPERVIYAFDPIEGGGLVNKDYLTSQLQQALASGGGGSPAAPLYGSTGQATDGAMTQKATSDALAAKADLVSGKLPAAQLPYVGFTPLDIKADLKATNTKWIEGELAFGTVITPGSKPGMKFISGNGTTTYVYEYMLSSADNNGTLFNWVRMVAS